MHDHLHWCLVPLLRGIFVSLLRGVFYNYLLFMQFLYYTTFRWDYFHVSCQNLFNFKMGRWGFSYIFKFFLEYFGNFIIFIYRIFLRILDKYDNSPLLKKVRIILLTIVIFWGTLVIITIFFSKSNRNFKHCKSCKINNKHPFITILKRFLFFYFFY